MARCDNLVLVTLSRWRQGFEPRWGYEVNPQVTSRIVPRAGLTRVGLAGAQTPPNPACELQPPLRWLHPDGETPSGRRRWLHQSSGERRGHEEKCGILPELSLRELRRSSVHLRDLGIGSNGAPRLTQGGGVPAPRQHAGVDLRSGADDGYVRAMDASTPPNRSDWHTGGIAR